MVGDCQSPKPEKYLNTTLVIALFRDPYEWMEAMRRKPWHWPNHLDVYPRNETIVKSISYAKQNEKTGKLQADPTGRRKKPTLYETPKGSVMGGKLPTSGSPTVFQKNFVAKSTLEWEEFIQRPMQVTDYMEVEGDAICQKGYSFGTISPCHRNASYAPPGVSHIPRPFLQYLPYAVNDVVYELAGDGQPYKHPLELRNAKVENFLSIPTSWEVAGFGVIQYNDILGENLLDFVHNISEALGTPAKCDLTPSFQKHAYDLPSEFKRWISNNTNWLTEGRIGYEFSKTYVL